MSENAIKYGIVGYSSAPFDVQAAQQILQRLFEKIQQQQAGKTVEIVSGYTNVGVPKIAYELADKFGFITVGFSAAQALEVSTGVYPVKKVIIIGDRFGDESEDFVRYIDRLIRVGGGAQSLREVEMFKQLHPGEVWEGLLEEFELE